MTGGIEEFRIAFGQQAIDDLHRRIDATRWPDVGWDTGWGTGTHDGVLRELVSYWRNDYDWFRWEERINEAGRHVRVQTDDTSELTHAVIYEPPAGVERKPFPLLLIHGWPGSILEFLNAAPVLASAGYTVITPSLPGFAWSDVVREPGLHPAMIARRLASLMTTLGYTKYGVQGGDWGSVIGRTLSTQFSSEVVGLHLNFGTATPVPAGQEPTQDETDYLAYRATWEPEETAYMRQQGTRPQTLGYGLTDSPVGLMAWILEKFWAWSHHDDDDLSLWEYVDKDEVITNVMIYWLTGRVTSAARIYYEMTHVSADERAVYAEAVTVPTAYAKFPAEPFAPPREMMERSVNLVQFSEHEAGGHFAAFVQPDTFARDVISFFDTLS